MKNYIIKYLVLKMYLGYGYTASEDEINASIRFLKQRNVEVDNSFDEKYIVKKEKTLFTIGKIIIYVVTNTYMMQNFSFTSYQSAIVNTILTFLIVISIIVIKRVKYYSITKPINT